MVIAAGSAVAARPVRTLPPTLPCPVTFGTVGRSEEPTGHVAHSHVLRGRVVLVVGWLLAWFLLLVLPLL